MIHPPPRLVSPRDLADAIGVSESSLKRWTDQGLLPASRTAGGHRRIPIADAIQFVRTRRLTLVRPELLGLPSALAGGGGSGGSGGSGGAGGGSAPGGADAAVRRSEHDDAALFDLLSSGHEEGVRNHLLRRFLAGESIAKLADGPLRGAMHAVGERWQHGAEGILIEHRATEICIQVVQQLRHLVASDRTGLTATGGAIEGDPYILPTMLAAAVLGECGYSVVNLGPNTPLSTLRLMLSPPSGARPSLVWVSHSAIDTPEGLGHDLAAFARECASMGVHLAIGGRRVHELGLPPDGPHTLYESMSDLAAMAQLLAARAADPGAPGLAS